METQICGIYKITNPSNKYYVGSSEDILYRWGRYKSLLCKTQTKLYNSIKKYGWDAHKVEVLEECPAEKLYSLERAWGLFYNVLGQDTGLNCKLPGYGETKGQISDETRRKMSVAQKGKKISQEHIVKLKLINTGRKHTDEARLKMSSYQKGKIISEETKLKMSEVAKGRKLSEETKLKMCISNRGKSNQGYKHTDEVKLNMSLMRKGKKLSEEHRMKMSIAAKNRWEKQKSITNIII